MPVRRQPAAACQRRRANEQPGTVLADFELMNAKNLGGMSNMPIGTVKWFNPTKGYGFIQPEDGGPDVFVHISAVQQAGLQQLNDGQRISFDLEPDRRGKTSANNLKAV
jgi:cold shock protein